MVILLVQTDQAEIILEIPIPLQQTLTVTQEVHRPHQEITSEIPQRPIEIGMATLEGHPPHLQTTLAIGTQNNVATIATPLSGHGKVLFFLKKKEFGKKNFSTYLVSQSGTRVNRSFHSAKTII